MNREYHQWHASGLGRPMELLTFGHGGLPVLVFPTSMGRFFEFEDRGMVDALAGKIDAGYITLFCVDSVDSESWYNKQVHPRARLQRHGEYEHYLLNDVLPLMRGRSGRDRIAVAGCSFGGYHAVNFALRHPGLVTKAVSLAGAFDIRQFVAGYYDDNVYFHNPVDYVANISDPGFFHHVRNGFDLALAVGDEDICLGGNYHFAGLLGRKEIPHRLDVWGNGTRHDWPWWRAMIPSYL
ncbi:MAG: esterase [Acidobacteria bacterium]|nr:esterase [Acidobacteriota bacterium]